MESKYRINVYVQTKNGDKILDRGETLYTLSEAEIMVDIKNKNLGHKDPQNILAPIGTKFAMYEDA